MRVLYVDDEFSLLEITKSFLELGGDFTVDIISSPLKALDLLRSDAYDAIVSDYQMPEMDGINFLNELRSRSDQTPFIIFTGRGREDVAIKALNNGADFYLQKGGDPQVQFGELRNALIQLIKRRNAETEMKRSQARFLTVFEETPSLMVLVDMDRRIDHANRAVIEFTGKEKTTILGQYPGNAFGCAHSNDAAEGCGFGEYCRGCHVLNILERTARTGERTHKKEITMSFFHQTGILERTMLISTSPVPSPGESMVLICLDEVAGSKEKEEKPHFR